MSNNDSGTNNSNTTAPPILIRRRNNHFKSAGLDLALAVRFEESTQN